MTAFILYSSTQLATETPGCTLKCVTVCSPYVNPTGFFTAERTFLYYLGWGDNTPSVYTCEMYEEFG